MKFHNVGNVNVKIANVDRLDCEGIFSDWRNYREKLIFIISIRLQQIPYVIEEPIWLFKQLCEYEF
jgi:hypothetical protein